jgi:hypothetical protein
MAPESLIHSLYQYILCTLWVLSNKAGVGPFIIYYWMLCKIFLKVLKNTRLLIKCDLSKSTNTKVCFSTPYIHR